MRLPEPSNEVERDDGYRIQREGGIFIVAEPVRNAIGEQEKHVARLQDENGLGRRSHS